LSSTYDSICFRTQVCRTLTDVLCAEDKSCEERRDADDKMAESRAAVARAAVARASAHVSRAEERVAMLDREASQAAIEATQAAERAKVGHTDLWNQITIAKPRPSDSQSAKEALSDEDVCRLSPASTLILHSAEGAAVDNNVAVSC